MREYITYQIEGIFVFKVPGILTDKRRAIFERYLEANEIKNYYLFSSTTNNSLSIPEKAETYSAHKFMKLVDMAKLIQLADNDKGDSVDIGDIVTRAVQREASALERRDFPRIFAGKRVN